MVARKIHPQYLDPVSANQINRDPEFTMNCHVLMKTHDAVKMEDCVKTMDWYVKTFARFRERVVVRQWMWPYWETVEKFDITQHIVFDAKERDWDGIQDYISLSLSQGM